jgi:hypothetical protein
MGKAKSHVQDGSHFVSLLKSDRFVKPDGFMVSLDIKALFPSLPMESYGKGACMPGKTPVKFF